MCIKKESGKTAKGILKFLGMFLICCGIVKLILVMLEAYGEKE